MPLEAIYWKLDASFESFWNFNGFISEALYIFTIYIFYCQLFQKKLSDFYFFYTKMTILSRAIDPWGAHPRPRPLTVAAAEKRRQFAILSKYFDFHNFNAKMTIVSRAINPWGAHPWPLTAAAAEKRRQFERFSKCFDFHNFNAKIT